MSDVVAQLRELAARLRIGNTPWVVDAKRVEAAAAELERLRTVIENAPHDDLCKAANGWSDNECNCWKADALS